MEPAAMAPNLKPAPEPVGHGSDDPFTFTWDDGTKDGGAITVPSLAVAPRPNQLKLTRAKMRGAIDEVVTMVTEAACTPEQLDTLSELSSDELERFYAEWGAWSGITSGESRAS
jgi:hypothetical protein